MKAPTLVAILALGGLSAATAHAKDITIAGKARRGKRDCGIDGGTATIDGSKNKLTIHNCTTVKVNGNGNKVVLVKVRALEVQGNRNQVKAGKVRTIDVMGNRNTVRYRLRGKKSPRISNLGKGNSIRKQ
ncbi:MAG: DUF3060 domain-containing protein [Myxococcales bacterium]|nr:DUF3060 domain-containing protein [Myxococcales bacterium]